MIIAQISDFHLKPGGGLAYNTADTASLLKKVVSHINRLRPAPDVIIITGDIADDGEPGSYRLAKKLLSPLEMPIFLVPGNHDQKDNLAAAFPEHAYLAQRLEATNNSYVCYSIEGYSVRLIGLDTVTPGLHGGGLGPNRLSWLDQTLAERPDIPTLIFMHHPPFASGIGHMDLEPFRGRRKLASVIRKHAQVDRITCGHIHRPITRRFGGIVATVCPGVGMQIGLDLRPQAPSGFNDEPPALMIHCLSDEWGDGASLLTHISVVENYPGQYGDFHPFYDVISPS